jgi:hypothetical protein
MHSPSVLLSSEGDEDGAGDVRADSVSLIVNKATVSTFDRNLETAASTEFWISGVEATGLYGSRGLVAGVLIFSVGLEATSCRFERKARFEVGEEDAEMGVSRCHDLFGVRQAHQL